MDKYFGELAALGTSFCWSFGSIFFTIASKLIGSTEVNRIRLILGMAFMALTHLLTFGIIVPLNARGYHWFWFGLSGLIGFTIGDTFLFRSYVLIGPRLTMLLMSLSPIFGTIIAWIFLNEILKLQEVLAIILTVVGIIMVLYGKSDENAKDKNYLSGVIYALGASFCQALGYFASKKGLLNNGLPALSGNLIRIMSGAFFIWLIAIFQGKFSQTLAKLSDKRAYLAMMGGAIFGPFIGVWLSLVAIQYTNIGIASTLMALPPIILIPLSHLIFREKITFRSVIGTLVTVMGVSLIFLRYFFN